MKNKHWTAYWQTGVLTSLPMDFKENYDGEIALFWENTLNSAQAPLSILDLCTGNGAVAILLQELADKHDREVTITAVDASAINPEVISGVFPQKIQSIKQINFIGNCLVENLPEMFEQSYDLIVSQYGVEYCDTPQAAVSVKQLLNPGGQFVFIAHAPETDIHQYMRTEEQVYQYFDEIKIMDIFQSFGSGQISANGFKTKTNKALGMMIQNVDFRGMDLFKTWFNAASQLVGMNNANLKLQTEQVATFQQQYRHARSRAHDMLAVSDKLAAQPEWYMAFKDAGLELKDQGEVLYRGKHKAGHFYVFEQPA